MKSSFEFPANISFECNQCGLCCGNTEEKTRRILLLESEAKEISTQTALQLKNFAEAIDNNSPYVYEIKKTSEGKCLFLKNNQCTIYTLRPLICRFYPFELKFSEDKNTYVFNVTLECPTIGKGKTVSQKEFQELFLLAKEKLCQLP